MRQPRLSADLAACRDTGERYARFSRSRSPKIALPTRTWVAPSWIAVAKSALMPIDNSLSPLRRAILAVSAKCGAGASSSGGMHISPEIVSPYLSRHRPRNASASCGSTPAFCASAPVLISTNNSGVRPCLAISLASASHRLGRSTEWMASNSATASLALFDCSGPIRCSSMPAMLRHQRRPFGFGLLHAVFAEHALAGGDHRLDRSGAERSSTPRPASPPPDRARHRGRRARSRRARGRGLLRRWFPCRARYQLVMAGESGRARHSNKRPRPAVSPLLKHP